MGKPEYGTFYKEYAPSCVYSKKQKRNYGG